MNTLLIVLVAVVGFCYFGENKCPKVLKDNKEMLLGVLVGLALCSFAGLKLEGLEVSDNDRYRCGVLNGDPCGRLLDINCFVPGTQDIDPKWQGRAQCNKNEEPTTMYVPVIPDIIPPQSEGGK